MDEKFNHPIAALVYGWINGYIRGCKTEMQKRKSYIQLHRREYLVSDKIWLQRL